MVIGSSGALDDEGETTRVVDDEVRVCCDLEGVTSCEDILDILDAVNDESVAFPLRTSSGFLFGLMLVSSIRFVPE